MGTKYSNNLPTGYNVAPPSDDGATTAANKIQWSTIKTKLTDCFNTWASALNTAILNAFDTSCASISGTYTTLASDNARTLQCSGTFTVSLGDASTLASGWFCNIVNAGTGVITVGLATGANTLNGVAAGTMVLPPWASLTCIVNQAANGFNVLFTPSMQGANVVAATTTVLDTSSGDFLHITGTTAITAITLSKGAQRTVVFDGALTLTNGASLILPGGANITTVAGDIAIFRGEATGVVRCVTYTKATTFSKQSTRQTFTSGSGTYTTPANATRIYVRMLGGGAGGGGSGTTPGTVGAAGDTTFSTLTAAKGAIASTTAGGAGGAGTNGDINITGGKGGNAGAFTNAYGAHGGISVFGGAGPGGPPSTDGSAASANTGSGGGGGGQTTNNSAGGGGGAGAYVEKIIISPSATYSYGVGPGSSGGAAGTGGNNGGAGAAGIIIVDEFYN